MTFSRLLSRLGPPALLAAGLLAVPPAVSAEDIALHVQTDRVANAINPFVYGHFFEHIYNGGDNGLWGEMVWNRSFEYLGDDIGQWSLKDGVVSETALVEGGRLFFGDPSWTDYEFTLQARKDHGNEGFLILLRGADTQWFWANIGGWNNTGHQLQHVGDPRNEDIGPRVRGRVESGRWYDIRVRCEGRHVETWLDNQKILDNTLPEDLDHPGGVGIGTWMTAADFRNMKVTDLKGKVLFEGLPKLPDTLAGAGKHWEPFGPGDVHIVLTGALNDEHAIRIVNTSGKTGITQNDFCLRKGESYKGSLWLKGSAPEGGKVTFYAGAKPVAQVSLPAPTPDWKQYPLSFTPSQDALDATFELSVNGKADLTVDQISLMSQSSINNDGFRPDIYQAFAALKPTIIRWPGGCYLEQYHWKNGIGPQAQRKKNLTPMWNDYDPNALGTDEYMTLCRKLGAEPLFVVNTGMHVTGTKNADEWKPWIQEACDWVEYLNGPATSAWGKIRAANGHPEPYKVKYFEIDNELWRSLQPSPAVYAQAVPLFAEAMKKVDPSITIIAHGGNGTDRRYDNVLIDRAAPAFDILSIHHYTDPDKYETGVTDQDRLYADLIKTIAASRNPRIQLDVSEWNLQTTDWRTGLYAAGLLNTFEKYGDRLIIGGPALLFRHTSAPAWDNAFINFDHKGWFPAPNYVMMKLWHENFAPSRLTVEGNPGRLNLVATRSAAGDKIILKVVNPTNGPLHVSAALDGGFTPGSAAMQLVAPGRLTARNTMDKPDAVKPAPAAAALKANAVEFDMPPISAGVVIIEKAR